MIATSRRATTALLAALAACSSPPEPPRRLEAPPFVTAISQFRGSVLEGSVVPPDGDGEPAPLPTDDLWTAHAELLFVESLPETLEPLATRSRLIVGTKGGQPLVSASLLTRGTSVGVTDPRAILRDSPDGRPNRSLPIAALDALLPKGTTAVFTGQSPEPRVLEDGAFVQRTIGVLVSRADPAIDDVTPPVVSLLVEDLAPLRANRNAPAAGEAEPERIVQRQLVVLEDHPPLDGEPLVLLFPSPYDDRGDAGFLVSLQLSRVPADAPDLAERVAACEARLARSLEDALARATGVPAAESDARALSSGIDALDLAQHHRAALVFLSGAARAPIALDIALTADDQTLGGWVAMVQEELRALMLDRNMSAETQAQVSWTLERAAWLTMVDLLDRDELPGELRGILLRHAGEVGRFAASVRGVVDRATDHESMRQGLVRENTALLESSDPAARVRAYDWLSGRGAAPAGFDPLADRTARREMLRTARDAAASASTETANPDPATTPRDGDDR